VFANENFDIELGLGGIDKEKKKKGGKDFFILFFISGFLFGEFGENMCS